MTLPKFGFTFREDCIQVIAATDNDRSSQAMMLNFRDPVTQKLLLKHAFPSMESHLSNVAIRMYEALTPCPQSTQDVKYEAYELLRDYFATNGGEAFNNRRATGPCLVHPGMQCPIFARVDGSDAHAIDLTDQEEDVGSSQGSVDLGPTPASEKYPEMNSRPRLTVLDMGSSCVDHSMYGGKQCFSGFSTGSFLIAVAEIIEYRPDCFAHEITPVKTEYLIKGNADLKKAGYIIFTVVLCPTQGGKPMKRPRRHSFGYLGQNINFSGTVDECINLFLRRAVASGNIYFVLDDDRAAENLERAALRGNFYPPGVDPGSIPLHRMLSVGTVDIVDEHMALKPLCQGPDGVFLCDAEQHSKFSTPGFQFKRPGASILNKSFWSGWASRPSSLKGIEWMRLGVCTTQVLSCHALSRTAQLSISRRRTRLK